MNIVKQAEQVMQQTPEAKSMFAAGGFSFAGASPNAGIMFVMLKDFKERLGDQHSAKAVVGQLFGRFRQITGAIA